MRKWIVATWGLAAALGVGLACGPELDPISSIETLRVVGLRKSAPYARPGEAVHLELLWEDGKSGKARPIERFIGFWCVNPPGDLFGQCLTQAPNVTPQFVFNQDELTITIPPDIIHPSASDPKAPPYGVAYVFYGVCAGHLSINGQRPGNLGGAGGLGAGGFGGVPDNLPGLGGGNGGNASIVPTCLDDEGNPLGSQDFVIAYSAVYAYEEFRNENPRITGFRVEGKDVAVDCIDADCVGRPFEVPDTGECPSGMACVDTCEDDGAATCPPIPIQPLIDPASAEEDSIAQASYGEDLQESLWVSYFSDRGLPESDVRLVNDANTGWNEAYGSALLAPKEPGPVRLWAVVRDNRGGVAWVRVPVYAR